MELFPIGNIVLAAGTQGKTDADDQRCERGWVGRGAEVTQDAAMQKGGELDDVLIGQRGEPRGRANSTPLRQLNIFAKSSRVS